MTITIRGGKQTIDPPMPSKVEDDIRKDDEVVKDSRELVDKVMKEVEVSHKVVAFPRPPQPFPQRLVKIIEDGKSKRFITMLKQLHQCPINRSFGTNA